MGLSIRWAAGISIRLGAGVSIRWAAGISIRLGAGISIQLAAGIAIWGGGGYVHPPPPPPLFWLHFEGRNPNSHHQWGGPCNETQAFSCIQVHYPSDGVSWPFACRCTRSTIFPADSASLRRFDFFLAQAKKKLKWFSLGKYFFGSRNAPMIHNRGLKTREKLGQNGPKRLKMAENGSKPA